MKSALFLVFAIFFGLKASADDSLQKRWFFAVNHSDRAQIHELLAQGADVDWVDGAENTALILAAEKCVEPKKGERTVILELLRARANVNHQNEDGRNALMAAAARNCSNAIALMLSAPGVDLLVADHSGRSAWDFASEAWMSGKGAEGAGLLRAAGAQAASITLDIVPARVP